RIRTHLEFHHLRAVLLSTFEMEHGAGRSRGPEATALPTGIGVVDPPLHPFGVEPHGIRHDEIDPLAIHQREQRRVLIAGRNRHFPPEPAGVEPVDPGVIAALGAVILLHALEARAGHAMQRPAFGTMRAGRGRTIEHFALAAIELAEMTAGERSPEHTV